jgi:DNA replication protein DnaC
MVELSPRIMLKCGIFEDNFKTNFHTYQVQEGNEEQKQAVTTVLDYCKHFENAYKEGLGIFFYGRNGTGKSHLSVSALKYFIGKGCTGQLITLQGAFDAYSDGKFRDPNIMDWYNKRVKNIDILVLDDVLKEYQPKNGNDQVGVFFDNLIRHRMRRNKVTIMSTNGTIEDFQNRYGNSLVSLLMAKMIPVRMVWDVDYRKEVQAKSILDRLHGR